MQSYCFGEPALALLLVDGKSVNLLRDGDAMAISACQGIRKTALIGCLYLNRPRERIVERMNTKLCIMCKHVRIESYSPNSATRFITGLRPAFFYCGRVSSIENKVSCEVERSIGECTNFGDFYEPSGIRILQTLNALL